MFFNLYGTDLAGPLEPTANYWQTQTRIRQLINQYLSVQHLTNRLEDLPRQFNTPQPRPWQPIDWHQIEPQQIIGIDPDIFLSILVGATETEAPIRGYTQTSRQYLAPIHPAMAQFVGGQVSPTGEVIEPGLWEKEERQHTPALLKIYHQLTGTKATIQPRTARAYHPSNPPDIDLYRHGLHRIATEYSAVCLYLWLMAHTTGPLQPALAELVQDEINHMTKFWGFGLWLFPESSLTRWGHILRHIAPVFPPSIEQTSTHQLIRTVQRMMGVLNWQKWPLTHKAELITTFVQVKQRMCGWSDRLTVDYLNNLFGPSPIQNSKYVLRTT